MSTSLLASIATFSVGTSDFRSLVAESLTRLDHVRKTTESLDDLQAYMIATEQLGDSPEFIKLLDDLGLGEYIPTVANPAVAGTEGILSGLKDLINRLRGSAPKPSHRLQAMDLSGAASAARKVDQAFQEVIGGIADTYPAGYTHRPEMADETIEYGVPLKVLMTALDSFKSMPELANKVLSHNLPTTNLEFDRYVKSVRSQLLPLKAVWNEEITDNGLLASVGTNMIRSKRTTATAKALGFTNEAAFRQLFAALREATTVSGANILVNAEKKFVELKKLHNEHNKSGGDPETRAVLEKYAESIYAIMLTMVLGYMEHRYTIVNIFLQLLHATHQTKK